MRTSSYAAALSRKEVSGEAEVKNSERRASADVTAARAWPTAASTMLAVRERHVMVLGIFSTESSPLPAFLVSPTALLLDIRCTYRPLLSHL